MFLHKIYLEHFRLFSNLLLEFKQQVTVFKAPNAKGKSSVIEGIRLLSNGTSFRAHKPDEMIQFGRELGRVRGKVYSDISSINNNLELAGLDELELSVLITRGEVNGRRTLKQLFSVNDNRKRKRDFSGKLLTIVFRPEDMRLVEGSPSRRRNFLDEILQLTDKNYDFSLDKYTKALRRRNKLLSLIKDNRQSVESLTYWDLTLIKHGELLQKKRRDLISFINSNVDPPLPMRLEYQPSLISEKRIWNHRQAEIATGFTLIGPHKDDFEILLGVSTKKTSTKNYMPIESYGSRGQKRMGVIWLKKAELSYLEEKTGQLPVLLLDDILSELDKENRTRVFQLIGEEQVVITTASEDLINEIISKLEEVKVIDLEKVLKTKVN